MRQCGKLPPTRRQLLNFQWPTDYIRTCIQGVECKHSDTLSLESIVTTVTARNVSRSAWFSEKAPGSTNHLLPKKKTDLPKTRLQDHQPPFTEKETSPWPFFAGPGWAWVSGKGSRTTCHPSAKTRPSHSHFLHHRGHPLGNQPGQVHSAPNLTCCLLVPLPIIFNDRMLTAVNIVLGILQPNRDVQEHLWVAKGFPAPQQPFYLFFDSKP